MNKIQIAYQKGYRVTKDGDLLNPKGKVIGDCLDSKGYKQTAIKINKKNTNILTHRLQSYQKYGDKLFEDGIVVRHLNGNKLDNSWDNIVIGTQSENMMDIPKEIRTSIAIARAKVSIKYPKEFVMKLREEYKDIKSYAELGRKYNMHKGVLWKLINKRKVFKDA